MKKQYRHAQAKRMRKPSKEGHKKSKWRQMIARYVAL
jgi:hypothetical protein